MLSLPALCIGTKTATMVTADGEIDSFDLDKPEGHIKDPLIIVCHAPYAAQKLALKYLPAFDVLELYAFVHPTQFCVPTINGIAAAIGLEKAQSHEDEALLIYDIIEKLITSLSPDDALKDLLSFMYADGNGWAWSQIIADAHGFKLGKTTARDIAFWEKFPEWEESAPPVPPSQQAVKEEMTTENLKLWLSTRKKNSEDRPQQFTYSGNMTHAFQPANQHDDLDIILAEAGTGIGKTLGYLNPSWLWAKTNTDTVWMSTYTKNLQRQIESELSDLIPKKIEEDDTVVIRKGRENYLCLLNLEEYTKTAQLSNNPRAPIAVGLILRWIQATPDGDFSGSHFHGWLVSLLGYSNTLDLSDQRGECIYGACDHYKKCFIEHAVRKSKKAKLVISNHALTMIQAALSVPGRDLPARFVFDEGHHLFDAADSAYASNLTLGEVLDLRRWLLGADTSRRKRARGLQKRLEGLYEADQRATKLVEETLRASHKLPDFENLRALKSGEDLDNFFFALKNQILARAKDHQGSYNLYGIECDPHPLNPDIIPHAVTLMDVFSDIRRPLLRLISFLDAKASEEAAEESPDTKLISRLENLSHSIQRRCDSMLTPWISMLAQLENNTPDDFIDWFGLDRFDGKNMDVGMYRRWVDPMVPFASTMSSHAQGIAITSATLRDSQHEEDGWDTAFEQTGARHFKANTKHFHVSSPFNYKEQSKIFIVNDVRKDQPELVGHAYASLMSASDGGALGIFTAISRLKSLHPIIQKALNEKDIPLFAQHIDEMEVGTLIDLFRDDDNACLIGTDAVRDGVDVPGNSLRMLIFERVPWPRPTILHKARRNYFGGRAYDERMTRLKLKQAFGRLIRTKQDRGVFVMLDPMLPSRFLNAFPEDVEIVKTSLEDTLNQVKDFYHG